MKFMHSFELSKLLYFLQLFINLSHHFQNAEKFPLHYSITFSTISLWSWPFITVITVHSKEAVASFPRPELQFASDPPSSVVFQPSHANAANQFSFFPVNLGSLPEAETLDTSLSVTLSLLTLCPVLKESSTFSVMMILTLSSLPAKFNFWKYEAKFHKQLKNCIEKAEVRKPNKDLRLA